jgi:hypothetical protein
VAHAHDAPTRLELAEEPGLGRRGRADRVASSFSKATMAPVLASRALISCKTPITTSSLLTMGMVRKDLLR